MMYGKGMYCPSPHLDNIPTRRNLIRSLPSAGRWALTEGRRSRDTPGVYLVASAQRERVGVTG